MRQRFLAVFERRHLVALTLAAGALALGGCLSGPELTSSDAPSPDDGQPISGGVSAEVLAAAAAATTDTGSASLEMSLSMALPGAAERVDITMEGTFDLAQQRGRLTFDYAGLLEALGPGAERVKAFLPDVMILDGDVGYLRMPDLSQVIPDAKPWVKIDVNDLGKSQGLDVTGVDQLGQADPTQLLTLLEALDGSIEDLGSDPVRGQAATHYRATINLSKLASTVPTEQRELLEAQLAQLREIGLDSMPIDVWIDEEGRVTRMTSTLVVPDSGEGPATVSLDITLFDFGTTVDIKTPAEKKAAGIDTLLGALAPAVQS